MGNREWGMGNQESWNNFFEPIPYSPLPTPCFSIRNKSTPIRRAI